jgi:valyl-tRNA synthetase
MGRNFCNKLWNAARFAMMNLKDAPDKEPPEEDLNLADRWIRNRLQTTINLALKALEDYRFSHAAQTLYHFVWNEFCDWYVEAAKLHLSDKKDEKSRKATQYTLRLVLADILKLLHPFLPFITEEIWGHLMPGQTPLIISAYPHEAAVPYQNEAQVFEITKKEPVEAIRNIRGESNVAPAKRVPLALTGFYSDEHVYISENTPRYVEHLAKVDHHTAFKAGEEPKETKKAATSIMKELTVYVPLAGLIDVGAETARLKKEIARTEKEMSSLKNKLANKSFVKGAPAEIVDRERGRLAEAKEKRTKLKEALAKVKKLA